MSDTALTQPRSWIVLDADGKPWGPFDSAGDATAWAQAKWPEIPQQDEANGSGQSWDVEALWAPN